MLELELKRTVLFKKKSISNLYTNREPQSQAYDHAHEFNQKHIVKSQMTNTFKNPMKDWGL